jgi:hypothetical protein
MSVLRWQQRVAVLTESGCPGFNAAFLVAGTRFLNWKLGHCGSS